MEFFVPGSCAHTKIRPDWFYSRCYTIVEAVFAVGVMQKKKKCTYSQQTEFL